MAGDAWDQERAGADPWPGPAPRWPSGQERAWPGEAAEPAAPEAASQGAAPGQPPAWMARPPSAGKAAGRAAAVALAALLALGGLGLVLDLDRDGRSSYAELRSGTAMLEGDSDGDGLADGWEADRGLD